MKTTLLSGILLCSLAASGVIAEEQSEKTTITVTGKSTVKVVPDIVVLQVAVTHRNTDLKTAQEQTVKGTSRVLAALREFDIEDRKIQTRQVSIQQLWKYNEHRTKDGYEASQGLTIILDDLSKYDSILPIMIESGVTDIHSIEFQTSTPRKYKDKARSMALTAAREKASDMVGVLGQHITHPVTIHEIATSSFHGWRDFNSFAMGNSNVSYSSPDTNEADESIESLLAPGEIKLTASVSVTFAFEPAPAEKQQTKADSQAPDKPDKQRPDNLTT